jgi:predicted PurR-regulated permease PerM
MEISTNKRVWIIILILFIVMSLIVSLLFYFSSIFIVIVIGGLIILISERSHKKFKHIIKKFHIDEKKFLKTIFTILTVLVWLILLYLLIAFTAKDINKTVNFMQSNDVTVEQIYIEKSQAILGEEMVNLIQTNQIINSVQTFITNFLVKIISGIAIFIAEAIIIIPLMFTLYFRHKHKFKKELLDIIPKKFKGSISKIINDSSKKLKGYSYAKLLESLIIAIICCIGFYIAGLKGWIFFGILCGLLNIIPYIGPWIGAIGPILVSLLEPTTSTFIITVITMVIAQTIDAYYLIPFLIPKHVNIQPLVGIVLILAGAQLYGPLGMLMAIPIYAVYSVVLSESYKELIKMYDSKCYKSSVYMPKKGTKIAKINRRKI